MVARSDVEIWRDVLEALRQDQRLDASDINVSVTNGVVNLMGTVATFPEKALAAELAGRVRGVTGVENDLTVVPATLRTDGDIARDVRSSLERDVRINLPNRIVVTVNNGVVVLSGIVESFDEKAGASDDAAAVAGVVDVINKLDVMPNVIRHDAELQNDIRRRLIEDLIVDASNVEIHVSNGVVRLTGTVASLYQKQAAEDDVWAQPGVRGVVNELRVNIPPCA